MSERKRKHHEGQENRPKKRAATDKLSGVLKVNWLEGSKEISPAIGECQLHTELNRRH